MKKTQVAETGRGRDEGLTGRWMVLLVVFFMVQVFFARYAAFKKEHPMTFDEGLYMQMGAQMKDRLTDYSTETIYNAAQEQGRELPEHYNRPLFVHPPLYSYLISFSFRLFGATADAAFAVSCLSGIGLIVLAWLLGASLFNERTGVAAGLLMSIEPLNWLCSQKIWMETTLAFFITLSLYLFSNALKKKDSRWMLGAGVAAGLAALTKYPGFMAVFFMGVYAVCCERRLFREKNFIISLIIPFVVFFPWVLWNIGVYGKDGLDLIVNNPTGIKGTHFFTNLFALLKGYWWLIALPVATGTFLWLVRKAQPEGENWKKNQDIICRFALATSFCVILFLARKQIATVFHLVHVPRAGWEMGMFNNEPWYFYVARVIELSPFYLLAYLALVIRAFRKELRDNSTSFLFIFLLIAFTFYTLWWRVQCRYIVSVAVPSMVLSAWVLVLAFDRITTIESKNTRYTALAALILLSAYFVVKNLYIATVMAIPNNLCYF